MRLIKSDWIVLALCLVWIVVSSTMAHYEVDPEELWLSEELKSPRKSGVALAEIDSKTEDESTQSEEVSNDALIDIIEERIKHCDEVKASASEAAWGVFVDYVQDGGETRARFQLKNKKPTLVVRYFDSSSFLGLPPGTLATRSTRVSWRQFARFDKESLEIRLRNAKKNGNPCEETQKALDAWPADEKK